MRVAAFDLGSNGLKLTVVAREADGRVVRILDEEHLTRLARGLVAGGPLDEDAVARTLAVLSDRARWLRSQGIHRWGAVGTAVLRDASNRDAFLDRARHEAGVEVVVVDGATEAALAFRATRPAPGPRLVVDVGGRSTELALGTGDRPAKAVSVPLGAVALTERFLPGDPPEAARVAELRAHAASILAEAVEVLGAGCPTGGSRLVGVSGTALALAALRHGSTAVEQLLAGGGPLVVERTWLGGAIDRLARLPSEARVHGIFLPRGRADVVVAGAAVLDEAMGALEVDRIEIEAGGVGLGLALALLDEETLP